MEIFKKNFVKFVNEVNDWKDAINLACTPLLENKMINKNFIPKLISETERLGPYYIMVDDLALGHISPDGSAIKNGISLLYLNKPVAFKKDGTGQVKFLFILSAVDGNSHLNILRELSMTFGNNNFYKEFYNVKKYEDIINLTNKYFKK
ncbi:PTS system, ascorbate-specific IIA component [Williamsoniiplasma somnilux]|uniref:Ascorbate-specific PTS system EIIA component n=1 Tax=Williamsoniiplasma somnilux TaxID=215578 RepID=A0A2K8P0L8_9MOLU|nr:PTS sugar transporter subunit IIA [Williamsoniiplasma somnilux]ATZ18443.1 PTS system, ascorbate-specific IIA component [Williamsoniiplasma somnilux]